MVFWIGILVAVVFACFAVRTGFYEMCVMLFNIVVAIYLAVFLRETIADIVGTAGSTAYNNALIMAATAIVPFLILHGISYIFLTGQFNISFPKILDTFVAAFLGFLAGSLVYSFLCLLICTTPLSQNTFVKKIGFTNQASQAALSHTYWWCNQVNKIVSHADGECTTEQLVSELLKSIEPKSRQRPSKPIQAPDPNNTEPSSRNEQTEPRQ